MVTNQMPFKNIKFIMMRYVESISFAIVTLSTFIGVVQPYVACTTTEECQKKLITPGVSICDNGYCTNPFQQGCLKAMGEKYGKKNLTRVKNVFDEIRICNSDDIILNEDGAEEYPQDENYVSCRKPYWKKFFEWDEIRIANSDWGTAVLFSYLFQIILTEVVEVPASIEQGVEFREYGSFYDYHTNLIYGNYGNGSELEAILEASRVDGDCRKTERPCAHLIPDVSEYDQYVKNLLQGEEFCFQMIWSTRAFMRKL